jgi:hypothetical protein
MLPWSTKWLAATVASPTTPSPFASSSSVRELPGPKAIALYPGGSGAQTLRMRSSEDPDRSNVSVAARAGAALATSATISTTLSQPTKRHVIAV